MAIQLIPTLNFNSDERHADETVVKIQGEKYYLWLILDSKTALSSASIWIATGTTHRLLPYWKPMGTPQAIVSDHYFAYQMPVKTLHGVHHIRVESFHDDITNNLISMFIFFYNFVRPHSALNNLTPAQCAGLRLSKKRKREFLLIA